MDKTNDMTSPTLPEPIASLGTVNLGVADDGVIMVGEGAATGTSLGSMRPLTSKLSAMRVSPPRSRIETRYCTGVSPALSVAEMVWPALTSTE